MESCQYSPVNENVEHQTGKVLLRQLLVVTTTWVPYFTVGLWLGTPTVLIPQMRAEANSTDAIGPEMASWISSALGYATIPWIFILSFLMEYIGRKKTFTIIVVHSMVVFTVFYFSNNPALILICEVIEGLAHAAVLTTGLVILGEYTSPKYRGLFLNMKSATGHWGIWIANAIGTYTHWSYIALFGLVTSLFSCTVFFWPESPFWLAKKGRYEECKEAHRWLKGTGRDSEMELRALIESQMEEKKITKRFNLKFVVAPEFYKPVLLSIVVMLMNQLSGKQAYSMYAIDIIMKITNSKSAAYNGMLTLDGTTVLSMYVGSVLSLYIKRRTILFFFTSTAALFLLTMSLYLYLVSISLITEHTYLSIGLMVGFSLAIGMGPVLMATSLYGELIPLRFKSESVIVIPIIFVTTQSTILKTSPYVFKTLGLHGAFLMSGISIFVCIGILYKYLPETKDKTLQEIEEHFKNN